MNSLKKMTTSEVIQNKITAKLDNDIEDIELVDLLNEYAESLRLYNQDFVKSLDYCEYAKQVSEKINYEEGYAWSLLNIGSCLVYMKQSRKPFKITSQALAIFRRLKIAQGEAHSLIILGAAKIAMEDHVAAYDLIEQGLKLSYITDYKKGEIIANYVLAILSESLKDYAAVEEYCKSALKVKEVFDIKGRVQAKIGKALIKQKNLTEAKGYLSEALDNANLYHDKYTVCEILIQLGKVLQSEGDAETAKIYFENSLVLTKEMGLIEHLSVALSEITEFLIEKEDFGTAINIIRKNKKYLDLETDDLRRADLLLKYAMLKLNLNQTNRVLENINDAWEIASIEKNFELKSNCQKAYADFYELIENFQMAYKHHLLFHEYMTSLAEKKTREKLKLAEIKININKHKDFKQLTKLKNSQAAQMIYEIHEKADALTKAENDIDDLKLTNSHLQSLTSNCIHCSTIA